MILLAAPRHDPDFARVWLARGVSFGRSLDSVMRVRTHVGVVSVPTRWRPPLSNAPVSVGTR
ncbi:hypothetical protein [Nocardia jejuensis]|uniref:hypothetical protein n=1 Tax=Nocardia jejuensis TaxID=328049 RepID=UPI0008331E61|nr:hypothetical protein [Nocardia jejuensis]